MKMLNTVDPKGLNKIKQSATRNLSYRHAQALAGMSKELHQPISAIHALAHKIRYDIKHQNTEKIEEYSKNIDRYIDQTEQLLQIVRYFTSQSRLSRPDSVKNR